MTNLFFQLKNQPILHKGYVGELVIYGKEVDPLDKGNPLTNYSLYSIFTIIAVEKGESGYYVLKDHTFNKEFKLQDPYTGGFSNSLFDLTSWIEYQNKQLAKKDELIKDLKSKLDLLKEILVEQGVRKFTDYK